MSRDAAAQRNIKKKEADKKALASKTSNQWWKIEDPVLQADCVTQLIDMIITLDIGRVRMLIGNIETYQSPEFGSPGLMAGVSRGYSSGRMGNVRRKTQLALPVVCSVIEALASKIATNDPKPQFLTSGGDYKARKNAELLTNLATGVAYETNLDKVNQQVFMDACIGGTGFLHIFENWETHKIEVERVYPGELITDPNEDMYGSPRSLYRTKYIDLEVLEAMFPNADKAKLRTAQKLSGLQSVGNVKNTNLVLVTEAWHLPSSKDAGDGIHVICTSSDCLNPDDRAYERTRFPIIPFRYMDRMMGFTGLGISELVGCIQNHLNDLLYCAQQSLELHCHPWWMIPTTAQINTNELNDMIGGEVHFSGPTPPTLVCYESMPQDFMQMVQFDISEIYQMTGVSMLAAQSQKPAGLNSGEAIRTFVDVESDRFQLLGKKWEAFHVEIFDHFVELAMSIAEEQQSYPVKVMKTSRRQHQMEVLDWKDAKGIKENEWEIQCFPVSELPTTPSGKLQYLQDLMALPGNIIDPMTALQLLNLPDTSAEISLKLAARDLIEWTISDIMDKDEYRPPDAMWDLQYCLQYASQQLQRAEREQVPEKTLELLRNWIAQVVSIQKQNTAALAPPPAAPVNPAAPQAPAPVSPVPATGLPTQLPTGPANIS